MLLSSLAAPLLANILANNSKIPRLGVIKADEETIRADHDFLPPRRLTNFEIQKYYQNKPNFNGVYSRNNLSKIKNEAYVINRD